MSGGRGSERSATAGVAGTPHPANGKGGELFRRFAQKSSSIFGSASSFLIAIVIILVWGLTGPLFHFSDTWQLVINTGTTIVTFLMVFLIQNTQNRDAKAIHLKLDELIRAHGDARNRLLDLEEMSDEELALLEKEFKRLRDRAGTEASETQEILDDATELIAERRSRKTDGAEARTSPASRRVQGPRRAPGK